MKNKLILAAGVGLWHALGVQADVLTPEQRADPNTGLISTDAYGQPLTDNLSVQYYGSSDPNTGALTLSLTNDTSFQGTLTGAVYPNKASVTWYKFSSDGTTPITLNMFGSNIAFGYNGFGSSNDGSMAVFNNQGQFVASNQGAVAPPGGIRILLQPWQAALLPTRRLIMIGNRRTRPSRYNILTIQPPRLIQLIILRACRFSISSTIRSQVLLTPTATLVIPGTNTQSCLQVPIFLP